ncbi:MAG: efflux RND transporter periplasmic adaptor subunit [Bauldia sp.]|nr:efflux RND transporter periplasmic adaptor subunit [Bauldia sp.]
MDKTATSIEDVLKSGRRPHRRILRIVGVAAAIAALAAGGWYLWAGSASRAGVTYSTDPAAVTDLRIVVTATGTVEPTNQVELSSELSGTIDTVEVDYNDLVEEGQVLARLSADQLEAAVELSTATLAARQAEVRQAEATVAERQAAFKRVEELIAKEFSSTETFELAKADSERASASLAAAQANLDIATANLRIAQSNLDKASIRSPIKGVVLDRNVEPGQIVASSLSAPVLFTLAEDLTEMELQVDIDEADVGHISGGEAATFTVEAFGDRPFDAKITQLRLASETVEGVVTYKAILSVNNTDHVLRPGMTATARIIVEEIDDALTVANAALRYAPPAEEEGGGGSGLLGLLLPRPPTGSTTAEIASDGSRTVWALRDGAPVAVQVRTGSSDGDRTVVLEGDLSAGDAVITASRSSR